MAARFHLPRGERTPAARHRRHLLAQERQLLAALDAITREPQPLSERLHTDRLHRYSQAVQRLEAVRAELQALAPKTPSLFAAEPMRNRAQLSA